MVSYLPEYHTDLHDLACRLCIEERVNAPYHTYKAQLFSHKAGNWVEDSVQAIENLNEIIPDCTFFCEKCLKTSVISYAFQKAKVEHMNKFLGGKCKITNSQLEGQNREIEIEDYYLEMIARFKPGILSQEM